MKSKGIDLSGAAAILAVSTVAYLGGVRPIIAEQTRVLLLRAEVADQERRHEAGRESLRALDETVEGLRETLAEFRQGFVASDATNERIAELAELADVVGVGLESVRPGTPSQNDTVRVVPIAVAGKGEHAALVRFLSRVKDVFPDFGIRRFSIDGEGESGGRLSAELVWFSTIDE